MAEKDRIVLGSGHTYVVEYDGETIPADETIETAQNMIGATSGGASLEYSKETYTAKSDDGTRRKTIITAEDVKLKSGLMTFCADNLKKLVSTGRVATSGKKTTLKIGGINNDDGKSYVVRFVHTDKADGDLRVTIVGKNSSGLTLAFAKDKETVVDAEFIADAMDSEGTLVTIEFSETE